MPNDFRETNMKMIEKELEKIYAEEAEEEKEIENMILEVCPVTEKLTKKEILDPKLLKEKLQPIKNKRYRDLMYAIFRLSIISAPKGSFVTLNANKILRLLNK